MISNTVVDEIKRLLKEKQYSQRDIALKTGVSRGTVNSIATGRRPDYSPLERPGETYWGEDGFFSPESTPRRCPRCGAKVFMPCLACHVRDLSARQTVGKPRVDSPRSARRK